MAISLNFETGRIPGVYFAIDNAQAVQTLPGLPVAIMVHGQMLPTGLAEELVPVQVLDTTRAESLFGRGSMLHRMFVALKANNPNAESWAIPQLDSGAGVKAGGSITFSGAVNFAGTLNVYIAGQRVRVAVAAGELASITAINLSAAINLVTALPVTSTVSGPAVSLAARHAGYNGNAIDIRTNYYSGEELPNGLIVTIAPMSGGSGNPDIEDALAEYGDRWWTDIVVPWNDVLNLRALDTELVERFGPLVMKDGQAYVGATATHAGLVSLAADHNSKHITIIGSQGSPTPPEEWAGALAGVSSLYGVDSRPLKTLPIFGVLAPDTSDRFTWNERNLLLYNGISTFTVDNSGACLCEGIITTYRLNAQGVPDESFLYLITMKNNAYIRWAQRARLMSRFPRHKLADDGTAAGSGQAVVTPNTIRAELVALYSELEEAGRVEGRAGFKSRLIVERDQVDPSRLNILESPDLINQLRIIAGVIQFRL